MLSPIQTQQAVHAVAHTARIKQTLAEKPDHMRKAEYERQLRIYRGQWAAVDDVDKPAITAALVGDPDAVDMNPESVAAAIAVLEG